MAEARRVVLLARPGEACERLRAALREAGGDLVLEADPCTLDPDALAAAAPQVVLVALDPVVEDALDRFDPVLADPAVAVIYDEADLAARREGWDAARWVRHLGAKLHQHDDVLPPGRDPDEVVHPMPGRPATPEERHADAEFATYASEAQAVAAEVPAEPQLATPTLAGTVDEPAFSGSAFGTLELTDDIEAMSLPEDAPLPPISIGTADDGAGQASDDGPFRHDLADLERRIASMELVDAPASRGPEQARGAVLVLAGIGGPDAVRQLLAGIPEGFSRPVLVCQRLDGGRYDRLVQQMARATSLPVQLAEAGTMASAGQVYIVAPEVGVAETADGLKFTADAGLLAALPPSDSAVLLLSGSDPADVDTALAHAARGALVAGQSPEGCYDAAAPGALIARGGSAGSPADLVRQLLKRWPA